MVCVLAIALLLHISFLTWLLAGLNRPTTQAAPLHSGATVIVVFKNELASLPACLEAIAGQDYALPLQVVLADDGSTDGSAALAERFIRNRDNWSLLQRQQATQWQSSKKELLHNAVRQAQHELLLFTDADCVPPPTWVSSMTACFAVDTALVAGFSPQSDKRSPLWNGVLLLDSLSAALVAAGTISRQIGLTCTGRNLAFRKSAWLAVGGYAALPDTLSGDDDFILAALQRCGKIHYNQAAAAVVPARGPETLTAFLHQKQRHLSSGRQYHRSAQSGYALFHFNHLLLWLSLVMALATHPGFGLFFAGKLWWDWLLLTRLGRRFGRQPSLKSFWLWQILFIFYNLKAAAQRHRPPRAWREEKRG